MRCRILRPLPPRSVAVVREVAVFLLYLLPERMRIPPPELPLQARHKQAGVVAAEGLLPESRRERRPQSCLLLHRPRQRPPNKRWPRH